METPAESWQGTVAYLKGLSKGNEDFGNFIGELGKSELCYELFAHTSMSAVCISVYESWPDWRNKPLVVINWAGQGKIRLEYRRVFGPPIESIRVDAQVDDPQLRFFLERLIQESER